MKLDLARQKDVQLLKVSGPVTDRDTKVLVAGITKLFKDGKNKIVLDLTAARDGLDSSVLRELGVLNLLARELAGQIVLAGVTPELRKRIETFAKPPVVESFETIDGALKSFDASDEDVLPAEVAAPPPASAFAVSGAPETSLLRELQAKVREQESQALTALKTENAKLGARHKELTEQLRVIVVSRRDPADKESYREKIAALETQLEEALGKLGEAEKK